MRKTGDEEQDRHWRKTLTAEQYEVARCGGTERAFTGEYWATKDAGLYRCVCCGEALFRSETKFDSGTGWPSFFQPLRPQAVREREDSRLGIRRVEVVCGGCEAHLGHVFPDGPAPTGLRYCMNSASLRLERDEPLR